MNYCFKFPVVRGVQANREYYIAMIPLKMLKRLFPEDDEYILPEYRAQRHASQLQQSPTSLKRIGNETGGTRRAPLPQQPTPSPPSRRTPCIRGPSTRGRERLW